MAIITDSSRARLTASTTTAKVIAKDLALPAFREGSNAASGVTAGSAVFGMSPMVLGAMGLTAAVSAAMSEVEFQYEKRTLRRLYSEELSAQLGKPVNKISDKDLEIFAKGDPKQGIIGNKTVAEAIGKAKKQRNIGVILSVSASLAALAVVAVVAPPLLAPLAGHFGAALGVIKVVAEGAMGLLAYNAVKSPLHWAADKFLGMDDKTTQDHITEIIRDRELGKSISQLQVMGVFVSAHPELDQMIEARYGQKFENAPLAVKQAITSDLSGPLHLEQLTADINQNKVNATELAFAVEGQASGVQHTGNFEHAKPGRLRSMMTSVGNAMGKVASIATGHIKEKYPAVAQGVAEDASAAKNSFVNRLGLSKGDSSLGFAERVDQSRADPGIIQRP